MVGYREDLCTRRCTLLDWSSEWPVADSYFAGDNHYFVISGLAIFARFGISGNNMVRKLMYPAGAMQLLHEIGL